MTRYAGPPSGTTPATVRACRLLERHRLAAAEAINGADGELELAHLDLDGSPGSAELGACDGRAWGIHARELDVPVAGHLVLEAAGDVVLHHAESHDVEIDVARCDRRGVVGI